ncbi:hypothetical protein B0H19DRAFT_1056098 [Mycena capillaripes]|nr:hypothetical protein B0H19DRAFT_1056098 [Mycena capillaripes]
MSPNPKPFLFCMSAGRQESALPIAGTSERHEAMPRMLADLALAPQRAVPSLNMESARKPIYPALYKMGMCAKLFDWVYMLYGRMEYAVAMNGQRTKILGDIGPFPKDVPIFTMNGKVVGYKEGRLIGGADVIVDIDDRALALLQKVQTMFLKRLLELGPYSMRAPLFTEFSLLPLRYRYLFLALRYLGYLVALLLTHHARRTPIVSTRQEDRATGWTWCMRSGNSPTRLLCLPCLP